ncbi:MAG: hypothetical protein CMJ53_01330 [Planctomycetaceae bacterium]|nr:hypothetical protein [Planctomycetaceae bacterium]
MNARHRLGLGLSVLLAFLVTILVRCSTTPSVTVPPGTTFVVYALDGDTYPMSSSDWRDFGFHGWPILKECSISHSKGVELLDELLSDAASANSLQVDCFNPRHGLRVESSSGTVDYLICFECFSFETWTEGREGPQSGAITKGPESLFSATLKNCRSQETVEP